MHAATCVHPTGTFRFGIHKPDFTIANRRRHTRITRLGRTAEGDTVSNHCNFPEGNVVVEGADRVYEVPNPFPFRGATYILHQPACRCADHPETIGLSHRQPISLTEALEPILPGMGAANAATRRKLFAALPKPILLAVAATSGDPRDLALLAELACDFCHDREGAPPSGLLYRDSGGHRPLIHDPALYKVLGNNPSLPDALKDAMVLRPGVQGDSPVTADWVSGDGTSSIFEYMRSNSYIPWGHFAANMANDTVRYRASDLLPDDLYGLRHLYCQRTLIRLAEALGMPVAPSSGSLSEKALEALRIPVLTALKEKCRVPGFRLPFSATLWGWNFGFDFTPTGYRLHGSHQQVHQQYALLPSHMETASGGGHGDHLSPFGCGDLVAGFTRQYREETGRPFFDSYLRAIRGNTRMDSRDDLPADLVVYEDTRVMLFVPKAQTSQWELQLMPLAPVGNILETDTPTRRSLDLAMLVAMRSLTALGAAMITVIEYPKRFDSEDRDQRLLYSFLPKLPFSPGSFTEAQLRWINNHFPEDFAARLRPIAAEVLASLDL